MSSYETNIYDSPEVHGLEVAYLIEDEPNYDFDMLVVWRRLSDGALFWAADSGCSCPAPFEDYNGIADLTPLTAESYLDFQVEAESFLGSDYRQADPVHVKTVLHGIQRELDIFPGVALAV